MKNESSSSLASLLVVGIVWYSSSCIATTTTKVIMQKNILTKLQLLVSQMIFSIIYLNLFGITGLINLNIKMDKINTLKLPFLYITLAYISGFILLQMGLQMVSVSFAVTCRGFEPVITCLLSLIFLSEKITTFQWIAVLVIVIGVSFCAGSDKSWTTIGIIVLFFCDMSFSCRSLFVKFLHQKTNSLKLNKISGENIYYVTCIFASIILLFILIAEKLYNDYESVSLLNISTGVYQLTNHYAILAANSACFTLYNAASYIMLGKIRMSYHAVLNSVRQVVVISFSVIIFGTSLSSSNVFGIILVAVGVATYSIFKQNKQDSSSVKMIN